MPPSIATCMLATCSAERVIMIIFFGSTFDVSEAKACISSPSSMTLPLVAFSVHSYVHRLRRTSRVYLRTKKMYIDQQVQSRHLRAFRHCSCELPSIYGFCHGSVPILPTSQIERRACNARMSKSIVRPHKSRTSLIVLE